MLTHLLRVKPLNYKNLYRYRDNSPGWDDPPITFIVDLLTDLLNLAIVKGKRSRVQIVYYRLENA